MLVIGLDGATWTVIQPHLNKLPILQRLIQQGKHKTMTIQGKPLSVPLWCSIFSGKTAQEHGHESFLIGEKLLQREDIALDFIWDILDRKGYKTFALNIPFVLPPYNFHVPFRAVNYGLPETAEEWYQELDTVTNAAISLLQQKPDLLCVVYTSLDRVQHYHWGEPDVLAWYQRVDAKIGELLEHYNDKVIVLSDHGFCSFGEAKIKTLKQTTMNGRSVKGDHHEEAVLITKNISYAITTPEDVFHAILREFEKATP